MAPCGDRLPHRLRIGPDAQRLTALADQRLVLAQPHARAHRQRVGQAGDHQALRRLGGHEFARGNAAAQRLGVDVQARRTRFEVDRQQAPEPGHAAGPARVQRQICAGPIIRLAMDAHGLLQPVAVLLEKGQRRSGGDPLRPDQSRVAGLDRNPQSIAARRRSTRSGQPETRSGSSGSRARARSRRISKRPLMNPPRSVSRQNAGFRPAAQTVCATPGSSARTRRPGSDPDRRHPVHPACRR